jgi:hypothetical protein
MDTIPAMNTNKSIASLADERMLLLRFSILPVKDAKIIPTIIRKDQIKLSIISNRFHKSRILLQNM